MTVKSFGNQLAFVRSRDNCFSSDLFSSSILCQGSSLSFERNKYMEKRGQGASVAGYVVDSLLWQRLTRKRDLAERKTRNESEIRSVGCPGNYVRGKIALRREKGQSRNTERRRKGSGKGRRVTKWLATRAFRFPFQLLARLSFAPLAFVVRYVLLQFVLSMWNRLFVV